MFEWLTGIDLLADELDSDALSDPIDEVLQLVPNLAHQLLLDPVPHREYHPDVDRVPRRRRGPQRNADGRRLRRERADALVIAADHRADRPAGDRSPAAAKVDQASPAAPAGSELRGDGGEERG